MRIISVLILVIMGVALLAGCGTPDDGDSAALKDTRWVLQGYGQPGDLTAPVGDRSATVTFQSEDATVTGSTGCNSYFGGYDLKGDAVSVSGPVAQTEMACPGPVMDQETAYMRLLHTMASYQIEGNQLTLNCDGGVLVYTAEVSGGGQGAGYTCDDFAANNHIAEDITLAVGETFELTLCANPSTGFSWGDAQITNDSALALVSQDYRAPDSSMPGAAGSEFIVFKALKAGSGTVKIDYGRPWEGGEKGVWTYTLNYTVK
jgi:heat shock protein HslJ/predicted secreted protein